MRLSPEDWPKIIAEFTEVLGRYETADGDLIAVHCVFTPAELE